MECEFFLRELILFLINLIDVQILAIHINNEFLIGIKLILFKWTYSYNDFYAISFA